VHRQHHRPRHAVQLQLAVHVGRRTIAKLGEPALVGGGGVVLGVEELLAARPFVQGLEPEVHACEVDRHLERGGARRAVEVTLPLLPLNLPRHSVWPCGRL
jgi:hypothetical protein